MHYTIHWTETPPVLEAAWDSPSWQSAETLQIDRFHPHSSAHRPVTQAQLLYDDEYLYARFHVQDQYVRAVHTTPQAQVSEDSCVEFFVRPCMFRYDLHDAPEEGDYGGYFNIEINCVGTPLLSYITDWRRTPHGFGEYAPVESETLADLLTVASLTSPLAAEITTPLAWQIAYRLPFAMFEAHLGPLDLRAGRPWRGNFFKCADRCSHPHWASWSPIGAELNFHQPAYFGLLEFGT